MLGLKDVRLPDDTRSEQNIGPQIVLKAGANRIIASAAKQQRGRETWGILPRLRLGLCGAAVLVSFGLVPAGHAQDATPAIPAPAQASGPSGAPASPPAPASPTPEHIAKARRLILATGISRSFQIIIPEFMEQIGNTLTQARPELVQDMNIVLIQLKPEFDRQSDEMIDQSARIYATLLSESDIDAILAFFDSDAGKRYVGAQPFFLNQLVSGMQAWQQKISINMMSRVREEMKKKGHDL